MRPAAALPAAAPGAGHLVVVRGLGTARLVRRADRLRVLTAGFGRGSAPRAGQGTVEVPVARVAVVHEAWRLSEPRGTEEAAVVKVVCGIECSSRVGFPYGANHLFRSGRGPAYPANAACSTPCPASGSTSTEPDKGCGASSPVQAEVM
ncbi:hypothetical protein E5671_17340 [Streptomyces sp. BA2]|nr:hypothetical protein [Streptomyces sp. BA2]